YQCYVGMGVEEVQFRLKTVRQGNVVVVLQGDVLAASRSQAPVGSGGDPHIARGGEHPHAIVLRGELTQDVGCAVVGAVVNDQQLEVAETLPENAFDGGTQKSLAVVSGHHHGNEWSGGPPCGWVGAGDDCYLGPGFGVCCHARHLSSLSCNATVPPSNSTISPKRFGSDCNNFAH